MLQGSKYKSRRFFPLSHPGHDRLSSFPPRQHMPKAPVKRTLSRLSQPSRISDNDASSRGTVARTDDSAAASATRQPPQAQSAQGEAPQVEEIQSQLEPKFSHSRSHAKACDRCYRAKRKV